MIRCHFLRTVFLGFISYLINLDCTFANDNLSIYQDNLNPEPGDTLRVSCNIRNFASSKTALWRRPGEQAVTHCTNTGYCTTVNDGKFNFSSDATGIYLIASSLSRTDALEWICTYLKDSQPYKINFGNISIYQNTSILKEDNVIKLTCRIQHFLRFKYASWRKQGGLVLTNCTNDGNCSIESSGIHKYSSDNNGIHVTISSLSITEKEEWKCTYLNESQSYNISLGTFSWTSFPKIKAYLGQKTIIRFGYESQKTMTRKSLYKEKCNANNCVTSLIGTFWNGELTTGELYQTHMNLTTSVNNVSLMLERVNVGDGGVYTCIVEHEEHHRTAIQLTVHEHKGEDHTNAFSFELDDDDDYSERPTSSIVSPLVVAVVSVVAVFAITAICVCVFRRRICSKLKNNRASKGNRENNYQVVMDS